MGAFPEAKITKLNDNISGKHSESTKKKVVKSQLTKLKIVHSEITKTKIVHLNRNEMKRIELK